MEQNERNIEDRERETGNIESLECHNFKKKFMEKEQITPFLYTFFENEGNISHSPM